MPLGNHIKENRKRCGLSQEKLAELVGVSRQAVTKWETAQSAPSTDNLIRLAEVFDISLDRLLRPDAPAQAQTPAQQTVATELPRPQIYIRPAQPTAPPAEEQPRKWTVWRKVSMWMLVIALFIMLIMGSLLIDGVDADELNLFDVLAKLLAPCYYGGFICKFVDAMIRISRKEY